MKDRGTLSKYGYIELPHDRLQWNDTVEHCQEFVFRRAWEFLDHRDNNQIFRETLCCGIC